MEGVVGASAFGAGAPEETDLQLLWFRKYAY